MFIQCGDRGLNVGSELELMMSDRVIANRQSPIVPVLYMYNVQCSTAVQCRNLSSIKSYCNAVPLLGDTVDLYS